MTKYKIEYNKSSIFKLSFNWSFLAIFVLSLSFTWPVMNPDYPLVNHFDSLKWVVFIAFFFYSLWRSHGYILKLTTISTCFVIFISVASVSTLANSVDFNEGLQRIASFVLLWTISLFSPLVKSASERLKYWSLSFFTITLLVVIMSLAQLPFGDAFANGRFKGVTSNANTLGSFSACFIIFAFSLHLSIKRKALSYFLFAIGTFTIFLTGSRTSWISAVGGIFMISAYIGLKRSFHLFLPMFIVLFTVFLLSFWYTNAYLSGPSAWIDREFSLAAREHVWRSQFEAFQRAPFFGHGLERDIPHFLGFSAVGRPSGEGSFFDLMAVAGIFGTVPFFVGLGYAFVILFRTAKKHIIPPTSFETYFWHLSALGLVTTVIINSVGEGYLAAVGNLPAIYVWIICGVASQTKETTYLHNKRRVVNCASL